MFSKNKGNIWIWLGFLLFGIIVVFVAQILTSFNDLVVNLLSELLGIAVTYIILERLLEREREKTLTPLKEKILWEIAYQYDQLFFAVIMIRGETLLDDSIKFYLKDILRRVNLINSLIIRNSEIITIDTRVHLEEINPAIEEIIYECMSVDSETLSDIKFIKGSMDLLTGYLKDFVRNNKNLFMHITKDIEIYIKNNLSNP